ncbi:MAG TPA: hypothetical protein VF752_15425 [Thermoleophilaceae bacterium]
MAGSLPPGPDRSPLRLTVEYVRRPFALLEECERSYGDPFMLRFPQPPPFIVFSSPAAVREVFRGDPDILRSGQANRIFEAGLGRRSILVLYRPAFAWRRVSTSCTGAATSIRIRRPSGPSDSWMAARTGSRGSPSEAAPGAASARRLPRSR